MPQVLLTFASILGPAPSPLVNLLIQVPFSPIIAMDEQEVYESNRVANGDKGLFLYRDEDSGFDYRSTSNSQSMCCAKMLFNQILGRWD